MMDILYFMLWEIDYVHANVGVFVVPTSGQGFGKNIGAREGSNN